MKEIENECPIKWLNEPLGQESINYDIYKIIPLKYLLSWFKIQKVRFDQISKWDDIYELFLFKQNYYSQVNGQNLPVDMDAVSHSIYGQSWSLRKECDALWRIYSPDYMSVKIHTTTNKLISEMQNNVFPNHSIAYLGKVKYFSLQGLHNQIVHYVNNNVLLEENIASSLFDKRKILSYEKEFRIVIVQATQSQSGNNKVSLPIYPFIQIPMNLEKIIDEVIFDYRLDNCTFSSLQNCIKKMLPNAKVSKSSLGTFAPKKFNI